MREDFHQENGHSSDLDQRRNDILLTNTSHKEWERVAEQMIVKFAEGGHPIFRATSPLSRGTLKSKGGGTLSMHFCADGDTIETVFRTIISVNQLSIYLASQICVKNVKPALLEQGDLFWQHDLTHCLCQVR